jgi:hypothetical protein
MSIIYKPNPESTTEFLARWIASPEADQNHANKKMKGLDQASFREIHRKGSHVKMQHPDGRRIVFPFHTEVDRYH